MKLSWVAVGLMPLVAFAQSSSSTTTADNTASSTGVAGSTSVASSTAAVSSSSAVSSISAVGNTGATSNTSTASSATPVPSNPPNLIKAAQVNSKILVIARDAASAASAYSGLNGYGIPYQVLLVPQAGVALPVLNTSSAGNFGGIIISGQVSYDYGSSRGFQSALTTDQWQQLYAYQITFGVRMVQFDVYPGPAFGATALGGCCSDGADQPIYFTTTSAFSQAGIKSNQRMSTAGLYHYPAKVTDGNTTEIAQFAAGGGFGTPSTAAVINNFAGRQQMVFFIGWATDWSATSNFLQHAYITWMTRGLYAGYRRVNFITQIDDMFLETRMYYPDTNVYRVTPQDMTNIANWVPNIQAKMNTGSYYRPEIGHNGNGNIEYSGATNGGDAACSPGPIETDDQSDTALEFQKPLGSGTDAWPKTPTVYPYTTACLNRDPLKRFFSVPAHRDAFQHITHTFSHYLLNNATYSDALKEIQFNQAWFQQTGIGSGDFTSNGLIPPAIRGLHNGDVLRAWHDAGLTNCVGDNTRSVLRNQQNQMYAYTTTQAADGYDGYQVIPRWATRIYYNCDTADCTTLEWINTSAGKGAFTDLMTVEVNDTMRHLFGLYHDGYMFHQANLRNIGVQPIPINGQNQALSIFQGWVETMVAEFTRLVSWPMITLKQSDLAVAYADRQTRDACNYGMFYTLAAGRITGVGVTANGNTCPANIPLTVPNGAITNTKGFKTERFGSDPTTIWVKLSGSQQTFSLAQPIPL